jgi:hypothetical protein
MSDNRENGVRQISLYILLDQVGMNVAICR